MSRRTAYHEAGHVLAAVALGYRIKAVSVDPFGNGAGLTELDAAFTEDPTDAEIEDALTIAYAGKPAEKHA